MPPYSIGCRKSKRYKARQGSIADIAVQAAKIATFILVLICIGIEL